MTSLRTNRWVAGTKRGEPDMYPTAESEKGTPILLAKAHDWLLGIDNRSRLEDHLDWYLRYYKGRFFETLRVENNPRRFEIFDIVAAETLSVVVPPRAVNRLLGEDAKRDALLDKIHSSLTFGKDTLWTCDLELLTGDKRNLETSGLLFQLYYLLKKYGIGPVTTSKLLAAKFPEVVPIRDSKVEKLLGLSSSERWWLDIRELFLDDGEVLATHLDGLVIPDGLGPISTLRRLDIVLWMEAKARNS
jgi:hypothetical protein